MSLFRSLTWRSVIVYSTIVFLSSGAVSTYLLWLFYIAITDPQSQISLKELAAMCALGVVPASLISAGFAYLSTGYLSKSVRAVTHGALQLAEGNFDYRIEGTSQDETYDLMRAFNKMSYTLRSLISDLSGERDKLSAILETMADAVVVVDSKGHIVLLNRSAEEVLGIGANVATGSTLMEAARDHELVGLFTRALKSRSLFRAEIDLPHQQRFVSAIATPLTAGGGGGVLLTLHDLTQGLRLETTRREFVSNVSHELRSPLASVKALTGALQEGGLGDIQVTQNFIERIDAETDRMAALVNDLLELSRLESGHAQLHLAPVEMKTLVPEALSRLEQETSKRSIAVIVDLPSNFPAFVGDSGKILQVLSNLLENALNATPDGGRISITGLARDRTVQVGITDSGMGISTEHLPHIFERFYKVDRARRDGGTGLGLAIVKHIVQAHGGTVKATSQEGSGSSFVFTLPRAL